MGATICYRPVPNNDRSLGIACPQHFIERCRKVFGEFPHRFTRADLQRLHALSAIWEEKDENPWEKLVELVGKHDAVDVWDSY